MKQDWRTFLQEFESNYPEEVLTVTEEMDRQYEPTALIMELERQKRYPLVHFKK